ncbi:MAG: EpsD family peptidyl-prolyl cis-trans isomerase [Sphingomonadaceae bacterium]
MNENLRHTAYAGLMVAAVALSGCGAKATGQVLAVVNGEEITADELNAELNGAALPAGADKKLAMRQLLQQVIDRRLLAQTAKEQGLDRDPAYLTQQRRMNEDLLVRLYAKKAADSIPIPKPAEIDQYVAAHPSAFAGRKRYKLDQLRFAAPSDISKLKPLESLKTMPQVVAYLTSAGIKFERGAGSLDSGTVPPATMKQILDLPPGEPFITPAGGQIVASVITGAEALTVPTEQTRPLAVQTMRNESLGKIGETRLKEARLKAKIEYQPGYEAPGAPKPAPAK